MLLDSTIPPSPQNSWNITLWRGNYNGTNHPKGGQEIVTTLLLWIIVKIAYAFFRKEKHHNGFGEGVISTVFIIHLKGYKVLIQVPFIL